MTSDDAPTSRRARSSASSTATSSARRKAKRAVAIALRNRWRRLQVAPELRDEIVPKNIIMIGPTGVGKTEIARRLAKLAQAPFVKVEASKFTEVGYVGRDVESIVRDLVEVAMQMVRTEQLEQVRARAAEHAEERLVELLVAPRRGQPRRPRRAPRRAVPGLVAGRGDAAQDRARSATCRSCAPSCAPASSTTRRSSSTCTRRRAPLVSVLGGQGLEDMESRLKDMLGNIPGLGGKRERRRMTRRRRAPRARGRRGAEAARPWIRSSARRCAAPSSPASCSSTRSTRSPGERGARRARRLARGRAARPAADRRGLDREHQVRPGAHRSRAVHRRGRVPRLEGLRPDPGAAGPLSDPRRARRAHARRLRAHPDRAEERADAPVRRADARRGHRARVHRRTRSTRSPSTPRKPTAAPRTSARAGCTRSWKRCSRSCRSPRPSAPSRASRSTPRTCVRCSRRCSRTKTSPVSFCSRVVGIKRRRSSAPPRFDFRPRCAQDSVFPQPARVRRCDELIEKAAVLHEALPYIRRFHGKTFVIKYGGAAMAEEALRESFARDVVLMKYVGIHPVVVHGGGPQIDEQLDAPRHREPSASRACASPTTPRWKSSRWCWPARSTRRSSSLIGRHGGRAVGLSGIDDGLLRAEKHARRCARARARWSTPAASGASRTCGPRCCSR